METVRSLFPLLRQPMPQNYSWTDIGTEEHEISTDASEMTYRFATRLALTTK
jgi:hypothetical protein